MKPERHLGLMPPVPTPVNWIEVIQEAGNIPPASSHVHFPTAAVRGIHGPMLPGRLYVISARTGSGKTLFVRTLIESVCGASKPVPVAYWGTETKPAEMLRSLAAARIGAHPARIEEDDFSQVEGGYEAFGKVVAEVASDWLSGSPPILSLYPEQHPTVSGILRALDVAAKAGVRLFILDHLLRIAMDQEKIFGEATNAIRALKSAAQDRDMVGIVTSQQNRTASSGDKFAWFQPPDLSALKGSGAIEEEADGVIFLYRRLLPDLTDAQKADARVGRLPMREVIAKNVMGVAIGKQRVDGSRTHEETTVWVENGVVRDLPEDQRRVWESDRHGIRTNRDL